MKDKIYKLLITVIGAIAIIGSGILVYDGWSRERREPDLAQNMLEQSSELSEMQQTFEQESCEKASQEAPLESEEEWIDALYNNIVTGDYQPVVELMRDDSAFLEAYDAAYDTADGLITSSGHWVAFHEVWGGEGYYDRYIYIAVPEWEQNRKEKKASGICSEYYYVNYFRSEETETWSYYKEISYMDFHSEQIILMQGNF